MHTAVYNRKSQCVSCFRETKDALYIVRDAFVTRGRWGIPFNGLYVHALPKRVAFFRWGCRDPVVYCAS